MKPMLIILIVLVVCLAQQAPAVGATGPQEGSHEYSRVVHAAEWTDHNVHDPGITILEAFRRLARRVYRALIRFGDGLRGRIPSS